MRASVVARLGSRAGVPPACALRAQVGGDYAVQLNPYLPVVS